MNSADKIQELANEVEDFAIAKVQGLEVIHADGERIAFDGVEEDLVAYLEGLLKAYDLIRCGIVKLNEQDDEF